MTLLPDLPPHKTATREEGAPKKGSRTEKNRTCHQPFYLVVAVLLASGLAGGTAALVLSLEHSSSERSAPPTSPPAVDPYSQPPPAALVLPPPSPDQSYPAAPPAPPDSVVVHNIKTAFVAEGELNNYNVQTNAAIAKVVAQAAGVPPHLVNVTVEAASVRISAVITFFNEAKATATAEALYNATCTSPCPKVTVSPIFSSVAKINQALKEANVIAVQVLPATTAAVVLGPPAVIGSWLDDWGTSYLITNNKLYTHNSVSVIIGHGPNFMYLQQGEGTYAPGSYQKVEWTWDATTSKWYMCTSSHGHATLDAVVLHSTAGVHLHNATHDQCGAFSNSVLSPLTLDVAGSWVDNWGAYYVITQDKYYGSSSVSTVVGHGPNFMYLQQGEGTYAPGSYQKVEWTWDATTSKWYMCTSSHGHATLDAVVLHSTAGVHLHNATHDQCGAFSNSVLSPLTLDVAGSWVDNFGKFHMFASNVWYAGVNNVTYSTSGIIGFGPNYMFVIKGEGTNASGTYEKVEWTWHSNSSIWYMCTTTHGHASLDAAVLRSTLGVHVGNRSQDKCGDVLNTVMYPVSFSFNPVAKLISSIQN
eukprot:CAMPEP_0195589430 /NCGR_PEP_ID=MMETSP0814-20130614/33626_1 /TAXON_ID=97485 /ORGANISM="Prymnesium parvum, Strain Texoma1" /LENGTH=586 /DNA_ID=CAMNT_0040728457 /DNA_START=14 /DNA_END=1774 /DNA_ORIENTATION=-